MSRYHRLLIRLNDGDGRPLHLETPKSKLPTPRREVIGDSGAPVTGRPGPVLPIPKMACVLFTVDERLTGRAHLPNEAGVELARAHPDVIIPFASLDPTRGPEAVRQAKRLVDEGVIRGLKLHPPLQQFAPNDRVAYPLYEVFAEARLPVLFHTGHCGIGTGMPGGGGIG